MEETPDNPKEYVKIAGIWQHTNCAWFVDREKMNAPVPRKEYSEDVMKNLYNKNLMFAMNQGAIENYQCVAHVHHWKTELEEYCRIDENWKCVRCHDEVPEAIQSMIKLYRPLKDV